MAMDDITLMRAILKHWEGRKFTFGDICHYHGINLFKAITCIDRMQNFGFNIINQNGTIIITRSSCQLILPRLRVMEAIGIYTGINRYHVNGWDYPTLAGAVMAVASLPVDHQYAVNIDIIQSFISIKINDL